MGSFIQQKCRSQAVPQSGRTLDGTVTRMPKRRLELTVFGVDWTVDTTELDTEHQDLLEHLWARAASEGPGRLPERAQRVPDAAAEDFVVTSGDLSDREGVRIPEDLAYFPYEFSRALTLASITRRVGTCLLLHAAGLAVPSGAAAVLVAASGTGKTTACRTLGQTLGYLSDETVVIEPDYSISPYPKPLSVIVDPERIDLKHEQSPDDLGLLPAPATPHLGAIILLDRADEHVPPELTAEPLIAAMVDMIPQTSGLVLLDHPLDELARAMTHNGGPYRLSYAEIGDAAPIVASLLAAWDQPGGPRIEPLTWRHIPGDNAAEPLPYPEVDPKVTDETTCRRAPWRDALEADGELLVLLDTIPAHLSGLGAALWLLAEQPVSAREATEHAIAEFGDHPDAVELVLDAIRSLAKGRVLELLD
jgi:hypothetical protein